jgi:hypothetical protein
MLKFNIDMPFAVYVRPGTRLSYIEIREYDYDNIETPTQAKRKARRAELSL